MYWIIFQQIISAYKVGGLLHFKYFIFLKINFQQDSNRDRCLLTQHPKPQTGILSLNRRTQEMERTMSVTPCHAVSLYRKTRYSHHRLCEEPFPFSLRLSRVKISRTSFTNYTHAWHTQAGTHTPTRTSPAPCSHSPQLGKGEQVQVSLSTSRTISPLLTDTLTAEAPRCHSPLPGEGFHS